MGFYISHDSFEGPFFSPEKIRAAGYNSTGPDLYCVNKELHNAAVKSAGVGSPPGDGGGDWYSTAAGASDADTRAAAAWKGWYKAKAAATK